MRDALGKANECPTFGGRRGGRGSGDVTGCDRGDNYCSIQMVLDNFYHNKSTHRKPAALQYI